MELFWTLGVVASISLAGVNLILLVALARELGKVLIRLGPPHAKPTDEGPELGAIVTEDIAGLTVDPATLLVNTKRKGQWTLVLFLRPECGACAILLKDLPAFARAYSDQVAVLAFVRGSISLDADPWKAVVAQRNVAIVVDYLIAEKWHVHSTPYAVMTDGEGRVISRGIVNSIDHLESLFAVEFVEARSSNNGSTTSNAGRV